MRFCIRFQFRGDNTICKKLRSVIDTRGVGAVFYHDFLKDIKR